MASRTGARVVTYGLDPNADLVAAAVEADSEGLTFTAFVKDFFPVSGQRRRRKLRVRLSLRGRHNLYAALAAVAVGLALEVPLEEALEALAAVEPLRGRLNPLPGVGGSLILPSIRSPYSIPGAGSPSWGISPSPEPWTPKHAGILASGWPKWLIF
jgi:UDP-N-acetylmuramyl pentapeptide synthase